jgi:AAA ATPase domain
VPSWIAFNAIDPNNAFFSFAVAKAGEKLLAGATRGIVRPPAERALRGVVSSAIETAVGEVCTEKACKGQLEAALHAKRRELADPKAFPDLPSLLDTWLGAIDASVAEPGFFAKLRVDKTRLREILFAEIIREVLRNCGQGGPLQPLAMHANFQVVFGLNQAVLAELGTIKATLEEIRLGQERRADRDDQFGPAAGARTLIEDRAATFTGREHIRAELDEWIGNPAFPSGYLLVTGEPGVGKTALIASLIAERNYLYHINDRREGVTSAQAFIGSICDQLARRYHVSRPPAPDSSSLSALLREVAGKASIEAPVVIAVDALDESDPAPAGANRLLLPHTLPPYVYFIITSRPRASYQLSVDHQKTISIDDDPRNIKDIEYYIKRELDGPFATDFARRIDAWEVTEQEFIDILAGKSQGNFMYIVYILLSVRLDRLTRAALDDIYQLPGTLQEYYEHHMEIMEQRWPPALMSKHKAAVRCVAAIGLPVSPAMLVDIAGEKNLPGVNEHLARTIFREWREFFNSMRDRDHDDEERFYVYHDTFRDFLDSKEPLEPLERDVQSRMNTMFWQIVNDIDQAGRED